MTGWTPSLRAASAALTCPWDRAGFSPSCGAYVAWLEASDQHAPALLWRLAQAPSVTVRFLAAASLNKRRAGAGEAPPDALLLAGVQAETHDAVGALLASLLSRRAPALERERLVQMVRHHPLEGVRVALAAELLVHGGRDWAQETLTLAEKDPLDRVRLAAMGALRFVNDAQVEKACGLWRALLTDPAPAIADRAVLMWEVERRCGDPVSTLVDAARARLREGRVTASLVRTLTRLRLREDVRDPNGALLGVLEAVALSDGCDWPTRRTAAEVVVAADAAAAVRLRASPKLLEGLLEGLEMEAGQPERRSGR